MFKTARLYHQNYEHCREIMKEQRADFWKFYFQNDTWSTILPLLLSGPFLDLLLNYLNISKNIIANLFLQFNLARKSEHHSTENTVALAARGRRKMFITKVNASS
jgi:hypothetical protein